jgi:hypothetical protein
MGSLVSGSGLDCLLGSSARGDRWRSSCDRARGVCGGVAFSRGPAATSLVSLASSEINWDCEGFRDGESRGLCVVDDWAVEEGLDSVAETDCLVTLDTGSD